MMAPAATAAASGAKGADVAGLFVADKEASTQAQVALANSVKEKGVEYLASVNYIDSAIKVSKRFPSRSCLTTGPPEQEGCRRP